MMMKQDWILLASMLVIHLQNRLHQEIDLMLDLVIGLAHLGNRVIHVEFIEVRSFPVVKNYIIA